MSEPEGRQGMSEPAPLERGYRRLLRWYPRAFRRENEEEILCVLMACAQDGQQRPGLAASADLIKGAIRMRLRSASRPPRTVRTAVRLMGAGAAAELAVLITVVVTAGSVRSAVVHSYPPGRAATVQHAVNVHLNIIVVVVSIFIGVWLLMAWALARGRDPARIAFAGFSGLLSLGMIVSLAQDAAAYAPADLIASAAVWLVALAASVLLFTGASNRYYHPEPLPVTP